MKTFLFIATFCIVAALALPQREPGKEKSRAGKTNKCLAPLVKSCSLQEFCEDPKEPGSFKRPLILDKSKISGGNCPVVDEDLDDFQIDESDSGNEWCDSCPYCGRSVNFCIICAKRNNVVLAMKEVSANIACEEDWMHFGKVDRRCGANANRQIVDPCSTSCN